MRSIILSRREIVLVQVFEGYSTQPNQSQWSNQTLWLGDPTAIMNMTALADWINRKNWSSFLVECRSE